MGAVSGVLVIASEVCDCIPGLSLISNLTEIFLKYCVLSRMDPNTIRANRYYQHLDSKGTGRCIILAVFGGLAKIVFWICDKRAPDKASTDASRPPPHAALNRKGVPSTSGKVAAPSPSQKIGQILESIQRDPSQLNEALLQGLTYAGGKELGEQICSILCLSDENHRNRWEQVIQLADRVWVREGIANCTWRENACDGSKGFGRGFLHAETWDNLQLPTQSYRFVEQLISNLQRNLVLGAQWGGFLEDVKPDTPFRYHQSRLRMFLDRELERAYQRAGSDLGEQSKLEADLIRDIQALPWQQPADEIICLLKKNKYVCVSSRPAIAQALQDRVFSPLFKAEHFFSLIEELKSGKSVEIIGRLLNNVDGLSDAYLKIETKEYQNRMLALLDRPTREQLRKALLEKQPNLQIPLIVKGQEMREEVANEVDKVIEAMRQGQTIWADPDAQLVVELICKDPAKFWSFMVFLLTHDQWQIHTAIELDAMGMHSPYRFRLQLPTETVAAALFTLPTSTQDEVMEKLKDREPGIAQSLFVMQTKATLEKSFEPGLIQIAKSVYQRCGQENYERLFIPIVVGCFQKNPEHFLAFCRVVSNLKNERKALPVALSLIVSGLKQGYYCNYEISINFDFLNNLSLEQCQACQQLWGEDPQKKVVWRHGLTEELQMRIEVLTKKAAPSANAASAGGPAASVTGEPPRSQTSSASSSNRPLA